MKCGETVSSCVQGRDCDFIPDWATAVGSLSSLTNGRAANLLVHFVWAPSDEPSPALFFPLIMRARDANDRRWALGWGDAELRLVSRGALSFQRPSHSGRERTESRRGDPGQIVALFL